MWVCDRAGGKILPFLRTNAKHGTASAAHAAAGAYDVANATVRAVSPADRTATASRASAHGMAAAATG